MYLASKSKSDSDSLLIENDICIGDNIDDRTRIMTEIDSYLCSKTNQDIAEGLKNFPTIRQLFLKYNCIRSSEAICESLFSYAGVYFMFEYILFLSCVCVIV